jgi:excisionase family DNA binding protein
MTAPALTPPQVARLLAVKADKVVAWVRAGELAAVDVRGPGATRPRWRILPDSLEAFFKRRSAQPMPVQSARRRNTAAPNPIGDQLDAAVERRAARRKRKKAVPARTAAEP